MDISSLPPGKYIRAPNGVIHAYNPFAESVTRDLEVFEVFAKEPESHAGHMDTANQTPLENVNNSTEYNTDSMDNLVAYLLSGNYPTNKDGTPKLPDISKELGFTVNKAMMQTALDEVKAIKSDDSE